MIASSSSAAGEEEDEDDRKQGGAMPGCCEMETLEREREREIFSGVVFVRFFNGFLLLSFFFLKKVLVFNKKLC